MSNLLSQGLNGHELIVTGSWLKICRLKRELFCEIDHPECFLAQVRDAGIKADLFTFLDRLPQSSPRYEYAMDWDNFAVIPVSTFEHWYKKEIPKATRRGLRKSKEYGLEVRWTTLDDTLVSQVTEIFNEAQIRQGRRFWHYGKSFKEVKEMLSRDMDRSRFLGAYYGDELAGFVKLISGPNFLRTSLLLSKIAHRRMYPNNALVAKVVEICVEEMVPYVVYGQMDYGKAGNKTLADFKVNNGFQRVGLPRYYVPLTGKGALCLKLGLHHRLVDLAPKWLVQALLRLRAQWYAAHPGPMAATQGAK